MFKENAERRVKLGLVLAELVDKFALKVDAGKVREIIEEMASTYQDPEEVINWYYSNQDQLASVQSRVLEDQMVEKLLGNAHVIEKPCSYQEALAQGQREA
jgi:trigger factor